MRAKCRHMCTSQCAGKHLYRGVEYYLAKGCKNHKWFSSQNVTFLWFLRIFQSKCDFFWLVAFNETLVNLVFVRTWTGISPTPTFLKSQLESFLKIVFFRPCRWFSRTFTAIINSFPILAPCPMRQPERKSSSQNPLFCWQQYVIVSGCREESNPFLWSLPVKQVCTKHWAGCNQPVESFQPRDRDVSVQFWVWLVRSPYIWKIKGLTFKSLSYHNF